MASEALTLCLVTDTFPLIRSLTLWQTDLAPASHDPSFRHPPSTSLVPSRHAVTKTTRALPFKGSVEKGRHTCPQTVSTQSG